MIPSECGQLLRACSFYDNRKATEQAMIAWSKAINDDITVPDAVTAIADHYAETTDWCMPAHVNTRVRAIRKARLIAALDAAGGVVPMPGELSQAEEREWALEWRNAAKDGRPLPTPSELEKVDMPDYARAAIAGFALAHSVPRIEGGQR